MYTQAESQLTAGTRGGRFAGFSDKKKGEEGPLVKICHDVGKLSSEQVKGLSSQVRDTACVLSMTLPLYCLLLLCSQVGDAACVMLVQVWV
jgi:hypothetical protein